MPQLRCTPADPILGTLVLDSPVAPGVRERIHQAEDYWVRRGWLTEELRARRDEALAVPGRRGRTDLGQREIQHGTVHGYKNLGCRCAYCRDAASTYWRERRARKVA